MTYVVRSIPQGKTGDASGLPDMRGAWIILQPIKADVQLVQSGHLVSGTYSNALVQGTMEGTLFKEKEDIIFIRNTCHSQEKAEVGRTSFQGKWKHSQSQIWDGEFVGEKR